MMEPWKMTRKEWLDQPAGTIEIPKGIGGKAAERIMLNRHRKAIERAFSEGKPVPPEVLTEYLDL